jgi:arabinoxylan arabinofuranohydrolase
MTAMKRRIRSKTPMGNCETIRKYGAKSMTPSSGSRPGVTSAIFATACVLAAQMACALAGNPIVPGIGLCDPHGVVLGNRVYLYASHDFSAENQGRFVTKDWWVWSSADLVHWKQEGLLKPEETFLKRPFEQCWAGFGVGRNGKYYWYFSAGPQEIGVVVAGSPTGPWKDPLGKPLVPKGLTPTEARDPDILIDTDGTPYMVYGTFDFFIVRLNDDMVSLAETPRPVQLDRKFGPYGEGKTDDKPSLHKRNGIYYLSWSGFYAMATDIYGPYTYKGSVIDPGRVAPEFQVDKAVRKYDLWHDRHGNFFSFYNQWYYACNDKSQPDRHTHFRDACISYVHYRDNGEMAPIRLDAIGVGQYDAQQPKIEAEDFFDMEKAEVRECPSGSFEVRSLRPGSSLTYPQVHRMPRNARLLLSAASGLEEGARIEIRAGSCMGAILGVCIVTNTGGWNQFRTVSCSLRNPPGTQSLCLTFQGPSKELLRLDWLKIAGGAAKSAPGAAQGPPDPRPGRRDPGRLPGKAANP